VTAREAALAALGHRRTLFVVAAFACAALLERWRPDHGPLARRVWRWPTNLGLYAAGTWAIRALLPTVAAVIAPAALGGAPVPVFSAIDARLGAWPALISAFLALDFVTYALHRLEHAYFPLWRLHAVHHSDNDVDVSTAVRHHPFEAIFNGVSLTLFVILLGTPPAAVAGYAALALAAQFFQHANFRLPGAVDRLLGLAIVTPGQHRVHHSAAPEHHMANFGTVLSVWDRWLRTLKSPRPEESPLVFGVTPFLADRYATPFWALALPFALQWSKTPDAKQRNDGALHRLGEEDAYRS
jgi:sterol desaturase/sphingolipid hydroxylase (fatty acid hydroxylase superfamily)